ncbi:Plasmodium vivax Vir protein, putative [Plasmodium vivax]|uniref:Vir protein, putative n=1 Tax=Plasmodium vivax TaxID=5855 RepID=A0A1G4E7S6_PLAVI|nr:Plasmodium vivax Vir protein, putative [Plasmodium vivax]
MSNPSSKPYYFTYNDYLEVTKKFKECNYIEDNKDRFKNIIDKVSKKHEAVQWSDKIFTCLHNYLAKYNGFHLNIKDCCRYTNFWLNKEVRGRTNEKYRQHFDIFKHFSHEYAFEKQNHYDDSCKEYIYYMEEDDYNRMKFLYDFFDMYINLKSNNNSDSTKACEKLSYNVANYNTVINEYYESDPNLYNKFNTVKVLIQELLQKSDSKCKKSAYFITPQKILEEAERERAPEAEAKAEAERQRQREAEAKAKADRQRQREAEAKAERLKTQRIQEDLVSHRGMHQMRTTHDAQQERFHHVGSLRPLELVNSGETLNLETQETRLQQHYKDQSEQRVHIPGNEDTKPDGSFLGSSGFPGYITGVLGSVDPGPVLGVSGGMGVLFILFKYTPFGSFFGGRRGRFGQIPRTFNGPFPGDFANFHEYEGGHIGYGAMNMPHLAE